jgi:hypothetical protein
MDNEKRISQLVEGKYQVLFGVHKATFDAMLAILECAYEEMRQKGGRKRKLSVLDMLVITLEYYHDYRTMENIAFEYGVHKQHISEAVAWVERVLIRDGMFALPSKRELAKSDLSVIIVDVTESETERQKKRQRKSYSGKHKCHTIKTQIIIDGATGKIICVAEAKGSVHDIELFKQSGVHISDDILLVGDKGYQGLSAIHANSMTPIKKPLTG